MGRADMPEPERLTLSGNTYIAYDFDLFPIDAGFHPIAAVYVVTRRTGRGGAQEHEVLYVGEAAKLPEHFADHAKAECFTRHNAEYVGVHRQEDEDSRRKTTQELIAELRPSCND
jgi:hypothetical protein